MSADRHLEQYAPWPGDLEVLVAMARYRHGWRFTLTDEERDPADTHGAAAGGLTLTITTQTANSYDAHQCETCRSTVSNYRVRHLFAVPPATWDRDGWLNWLMDCVEQVELHEAREFFQLRHLVAAPTDMRDGLTEHIERPFAPNHGPGRDPYRRYSYASDENRRTTFRGELKS